MRYFRNHLKLGVMFLGCVAAPGLCLASQDLLRSVQTSNLADVTQRLNNGENLEFVGCLGGDRDDMTPLLVSAIDSNAAMMEYLLGRGANVGAVDRYGGSALFYSINHCATAGKQADSLAKVAALIQHRADTVTPFVIDAGAGVTRTPVAHAQLMGCHEIAEMILDHNNKPAVQPLVESHGLPHGVAAMVADYFAL